MKAMILAAGYGRRLLPITNKIPKPLLKVGEQTLLERNINCLISSGFSEIIINVSHLSKLIINFVENTFPNQNILFSQEDQPLGTGGGILNALDLIGNETQLCHRQSPTLLEPLSQRQNQNFLWVQACVFSILLSGF